MGEYAQGTGSTLDFNFVGSDDYVQPAGATLDFELLEAQRLQVSETLGVTDEYDREASYFRNYVAKLAFNDADIRNLNKRLDEIVGVNDVTTKNTSKQVTDTLSMADVYSREASYFRDYNESITLNDVTELLTILRLDEQLTVNDSDIRQVEKLLFEGLGLTSVYSRDADYFRSYSETLGLNDFLTTVKIQFLNVSETLGLNDTTELLTILRLDEQLNVNEFYSRVGQFFRNYDEVVSIDEEFSFVAKLVRNESLALDTFAPITTLLELDEGLGVNDFDSYVVGKLLTESFSLDDSIRERNVFTVKTERLGVNDADIRELQRTLQEAMGVNGVYSRTGSFFRDYGEDFSLDDTDTKFFMKLLETETLGVSDDLRFTVGKVLDERMSLGEVFITDADYFRSIDESFSLAEQRDFEQILFREFSETLALDATPAKQLQRTLNESFGLNDVFNQFFSEGPGTPPYYVRNAFVQGNSVQNAFKQLNKLQNQIESKDVNNSFGDKGQS